MPFARPTLTQLRAQALADIDSALPGTDARLRFSNLGVLAQVLIAAVVGLYGYIDYLAKAFVPFTAMGEWLAGWGALKNVFYKQSTYASGSAVFNGQPGSVLPAGTPVTRGDGYRYQTVADATADVDGNVAVQIIAQSADSAGNAASGVILTLGNAVAGIRSGGAASSDLTGGADLETEDDYRVRVLQAYAHPPQGGDFRDYIEWAEAVPGVTRAWVNPRGMGLGTLTVLFMMDIAELAYAGFPQGTNGVGSSETRVSMPAAGDQLLVANALFPLQPVTALVYVAAPVANLCNFTIGGIAGATTQTKAAIAAAIDAVMIAQATPGGALDIDGAVGGVLDISLIEAAIAAIPAAQGFVIETVTCNHGSVSPGASGNITSNAGCIATRWAMTYV